MLKKKLVSFVKRVKEDKTTLEKTISSKEPLTITREKLQKLVNIHTTNLEF